MRFAGPAPSYIPISNCVNVWLAKAELYKSLALPDISESPDVSNDQAILLGTLGGVSFTPKLATAAPP